MVRLPSPRLLIVDDEASIRRSLRRELRQMALVIEDFSDSAAALERHLEEPFQVAILDLRMPGMSGVELARLLIEISDVGIVFLTGEGNSPLADEARRQGPEVVAKPWDAAVLARIVDELLQKGRER